RHRIGQSYNEQSGRYSQLEPDFWIPAPDRPLLPVEGYKSARPQFGPATDDEYRWLVESIKENSKECYIRYQEALDRNYAKEVARVHLPVNIRSSCWVTVN